MIPAPALGVVRCTAALDPAPIARYLVGAMRGFRPIEEGEPRTGDVVAKGVRGHYTLHSGKSSSDTSCTLRAVVQSAAGSIQD